MSKDPAFLFYYQDFLVGTDHMTNEAVGAYARCLCYQAHKGFVSVDHMRSICKKQKTMDAILDKFESDGTGNLFNNKLKEIQNARDAYLKHQSESGKKGAKKRWQDNSF